MNVRRGPHTPRFVPSAAKLSVRVSSGIAVVRESQFLEVATKCEKCDLIVSAIHSYLVHLVLGPFTTH